MLRPPLELTPCRAHGIRQSTAKDDRTLLAGTPASRRPGAIGILSIGLAILTAQLCTGAQAPDWKSIRIEPEDIVLSGPGLSQNFLVTATDAEGNERDVTFQCEISSSDPAVIEVDGDRGRLAGRRPGLATIRAEFGPLAVETEVPVGASASEMAVSFSPDIVSILTLKGCNGSSCHGSPVGQSGFKLSLFGYDVAADHEMIVDAHDGRRVDLDRPERSLLLRKPTFEVAHGGGRLLETDSEAYEAILSWLGQGAPFDTRGVQLERLELYPPERTLVGTGSEQRLVAVGRLSDGSSRDMTSEVRYFAGNDAVAQVSADGLLRTAGPGLTSVMARAMGKVATSQIGVIEGLADFRYPNYEFDSFIDDAVFAKLRQLNVRPAALASDREFVRRAYLDAIGLLPTSSELHEFLNDSRPDKRSRLIDRLLERPEYASHWTVKFEDWFRNCQLHSQGRSMGVFKDWVRDWIAADRPYNDFVRALLTSTGDTMLNPGANFWHPATDFMLKEFSVTKVTPTVSRLFLGVRMECAECHNHPLENFTQDDFYGLAAFFARMRVKHGYGEYRRTWYLDEEGEVAHPVTRTAVIPKFLGGETPEIPNGADRRAVLADWIVSPQNPYFARATVNRIWHQYFGMGIVEPYDDFRSTNRPSNPELLDGLAEFFADNGYRLKPLHRLILSSRTYQLSSSSDEAGPLDQRLFARYMPRKLQAEVLLDALGQVTGVPHSFPGYPSGTLAKDIYVPDGPDYFLITFGLPRRDILKDRVAVPTLSQALHLMNGDAVRAKVEARANVVGELVAQGFGDRQIVETIYERAYARLPTAAEIGRISDFIANESAAGRGGRRALENVLWAVLNSKEFQLNH